MRRRKRSLLLALLVSLGPITGVAAQALDGATLYAKNCAACHQLGGTGISGAFPALQGNLLVQSAPEILIATVLKGRGGMPTFAAAIDDPTLALVLSYIRQAWGNQAGAINALQVGTVRSLSNAGEAVQPEQPSNVH